MRKIKCISVFILSGFLIFNCAALASSGKWSKLVEKSGVVLEEIQEMPDNSIPDDLLRGCEALAVFPDTISVGFGVGGQYGQGIIMARNEKSRKWSSPAIFTLTGGSIGFQIGGQATDVVLLIMSRKSVEGILKGKFKLGADASVAVGPVGRNAEASTDIMLKGGILSYSRSRGLFAGVKLEGAFITEHWDGDLALYGKSLPAEEILLENKAKMPESASRILKVLNKYN